MIWNVLTIENKLEQSQQFAKKIKLCANKIQYRIERFTIQILLQSKFNSSEQFAKLDNFKSKLIWKYNKLSIKNTMQV